MTILNTVIETTHGKISVQHSDTNGPAVMFIHGNSSCKEVFHHQVEKFANEYRLILLDLPGHGASENAINPSKTYTQSAYADVALEVLGNLGVEEVCVMGWSLGGHIGIEMIAKSSIVRSLAITGTPPCGPGNDAVNAAFTPLPHMSFTSKEVFSQADSEAYAHYTLGVNAPKDDHLIEAVKRTDGKARHIMWNDWTIGNNGVDQMATIKTWARPIAVIQGGEEPFFDNGYISNLDIGNLWGNKIHLIDETGHAPFWETLA